MQLNCRFQVRRAALLLGGASALSLALGSAAFAQEVMETVIVTGVRASLQSAQSIKQNADTIVDSISATDIGAMPDKSVAEALQRVPGITVSRFASSGDTSHFSAEPSGVLIRGLPQVRSEFNGRDSFNANSSRGLSWSDVSPELMANIDSYKNQTADMIEGGIAGTINLRTRVPFDSADRVWSVGGNLNYGTLGDRVTPDLSGLYSDRFKTSRYGEFGVLLNVAYSNVYTGTEGTQIGRIFQYTDPNPGGTGNKVWIPDGGDVRTDRYKRQRVGGSFAAQWQNDSGTLLGTFQFNYSEYANSFKEYAVVMRPNGYGDMDALVPSTGPQTCDIGANAGCQADWMLPPAGHPFTYNSAGLMVDGILTGKNSWNGLADAGAGLRTYPDGIQRQFQCQPWYPASCSTTGGDLNRLGEGFSNETRYNNNREYTWDASFNLKWDPSEKLHFNADTQYIRSGINNYDITANLRTWYPIELDLRGPGGHPQWKPGPTGQDAMNLWPGGLTALQNYFPEYVMDHKEHSKGYESATRFDVSYDVGTPWLNQIKAGFRWADRLQNVAWSTYNWQGFRPNWTWVPSSTPAAPWYASDINAKYLQTYNFGSDFLYPGTFPAINLPWISMDTIVHQNQIAALADSTKNGGLGSWVPVCERAADVAGTCFTPAEMINVRETTLAGYAMVKFGGPDVSFFNDFVKLSGNIGARFIDTVVTSSGGVTFPVPFNRPTPAGGGDACTPDPTGHISAWCNITQQDLNFANGAYYLVANKKHLTHFLPSLTIKLDLPQDWVIRIAASRALARPDMGLLRAYTVLSGSYNSAAITTTSPATVVNFSGDSGNPSLLPTTADQFDVSFERYFAAVGSFSFDIFYKQFHNYIQYGTFQRAYTNPSNGITRTATMRGPMNGHGGQIKGFEVAYTRYMDFLPGFWSGFGVQANLTMLKNSGIQSSGLSSTSASGNTSGATQGTFRNLPLEGMSDIQANLVGLYERGDWAVRLAYNWKSKYLVSAADCCIRTDIFAKAYGQLDGSVRYAVTDHIEASVQGSNILGSPTVLQQQVADPRLLMPRSWFINDRRMMLGLRLKY